MAAPTYSFGLNETITVGGNSYPSTNSYTGDALALRSIDVPGDATNLEVDFVLDVSAISAILIVSTINVEMFTNDVDGGSPDDTISLLAGVPYVWAKGYLANLLTVDIDKLFFSEENEPAAAGVVTIAAVYDSTSPG